MVYLNSVFSSTDLFAVLSKISSYIQNNVGETELPLIVSTNNNEISLTVMGRRVMAKAERETQSSVHWSVMVDDSLKKVIDGV